MHVVKLAELAAVMTHHGPALLYRHASVSPEAVNCYWTASRQRLELWHQALIRFQRAKDDADSSRVQEWWQDHIGVVEEILASELLTRVMAAIADGSDRASGRDEFSPIAQAIYLSHLEVRNRVQMLLLDRRGCSVSDAMRLNRLRRLVERWIDVLIGELACYDEELLRYGVDEERTRCHADDSDGLASSPQRQMVGCLIRASMTDSIQRRVAERASLPLANQAVAESVLLMLRPEMFDSVGVLKSLCLHRIENQATRTDQMIDDYLRPNLDDSPTASAIDTVNDTAWAQWYR
ncbi:hypothetical protein [Allorhodopirellula solitaria]|uniref:Uncharacterized protein n=1 Tax=Allorhodopirellula solitaria TaxID=2527987 RepID=A0A5C5X1R2_9BACT|nr:hypothetical protein [Allorhodopirellula solitaria]TWT56093.1 hypothetical protein CA85_45660 [Allorhodopirellula solitaria]